MSDVADTVRDLYASLREHPARVAASAIGVVWGTAALLVVLAWGGGLREYVRVEMGRYGRPSIEVLPGVTSSGFPPVRPGVPVRFARRDVAAVERDNPALIEAALPQHFSARRVEVEAAGRVRRLDLTGTDERFPAYRSFRIGTGRYFDRREVRAGRPVAVLGFDASAELFGDPGAAVGRRIRIEGRSFEVIGVAARKGRQYVNTARADNRLLLVPLTAAETRLGLPDELARFSLFPRSGVDPTAALAAARRTLGLRCGFDPRDVDALRTYDLTRALRASDLFHAGFVVFLGAAGATTLAVGGLAIANVELATLAERALEIGLAKALGARDRQLAQRVVLETATVVSGAASLGVALGLAGCELLRRLARDGALPTPVVTPAAVAMVAAAIAVVTVVACAAPARRVRRMEIAAALRAAL